MNATAEFVEGRAARLAAQARNDNRTAPAALRWLTLAVQWAMDNGMPFLAEELGNRACGVQIIVNEERRYINE